MTLHSTVDSFITFDDITTCLHESIEKHHRGAIKVLMDNCGSPSASTQKRNAGEADLSPDRSSRSCSRVIGSVRHDSTLPLTLTASIKKNSGTMDSASSPSSGVVGDGQEAPDTPPAPTITLDRAFSSWLSDCQLNAALDLQGAQEKQAANNEQLEEQMKLEGRDNCREARA
ncbi:hypothetical protein ACHAPA_012149 [Fusarium lateritium]